MNPFLGGGSRPIVVGHRGVPAIDPENTLSGFRRAAELGVDAVELDVRLTSDGHAVVCHDEDLHRLTGERRQLSKSTLDEVSRLRIRRVLPMGIDAYGEQVVIEYEREERIPLLAEVFAELGSRVAYNVELKLDTAPWWQTRVAEVTAQEIAAAGLEDRVIVTSFDLRKLRVAKRANPKLTVGFCFDDSMLDVLGRFASKARRLSLLRFALASNLAGRFLDASVVGADHTLVTAEVANALRSRGLSLGTHTLFPIGSTTGKPIPREASEVAEAKRLAALGVRWIESDDPERLLEVLS